MVEAGNARYAQPHHDGKACPVNNRKFLVPEQFADSPRRLEVRRGRLFELHASLPDTPPKLFRGEAVNSAVQKKPSFNEYMIRQKRSVDVPKENLCTGVALIADVGRSEPDGTINEDVHAFRRLGDALRGLRPVLRKYCSHTAWPSILSLSRATSVGSPEEPRSKKIEISALRFGSPKSEDTRRRTYSANEMPSSAALACARRCVSGSIVI